MVIHAFGLRWSSELQASLDNMSSKTARYRDPISKQQKQKANKQNTDCHPNISYVFMTLPYTIPTHTISGISQHMGNLNTLKF